MRALALVIALAGCSFSPDIGDGTIACGPGGSCPPGFVCGVGARCFLPKPPPPPADASTPDAADPMDAPPCKKHCTGPDCCH